MHLFTKVSNTESVKTQSILVSLFLKFGFDSLEKSIWLYSNITMVNELHRLNYGLHTTCPEEWTPETELRAALQLVLKTNELQRLNKGLHYNLSWGPMNSRYWTNGNTTTCPVDQWTPEIEQRAALQLVLRTNEPQRLNKGLHYNLSCGPMNPRDWTKGCTTTCPEDQWTPEIEQRAALQLVLTNEPQRLN